jgi:predicted CXXCH cytochrome family protein
MKKTTLLIGIGVASVAVALLAVLGSGGGTALADGGPHVTAGDATNATPDKCAACHRIHTGQAPKLLKSGPTIADFCYSCHGNGGPGSDLAVSEGTYYGGTTPGSPYGDKTASTTVGLRAGGFVKARINTQDPTITGIDPTVTIGVLPVAQTVNSWHAIDGTTAGTMWGNGAIGSGAGPSYALSCTSCHDPHGNGNYRILRGTPEGSNAATPVNITDQPDPKTYTTDNYFQMGITGMTIKKDTSTWCSQCHTRYSQSDFTHAESPTGDPIFAYQHKSNGFRATGESNVACITCHAAHGSNAQMPGAYSSTVPWPGGGLVNPSNDTQRASLLKMDNRGMCRKCHSLDQIP